MAGQFWTPVFLKNWEAYRSGARLIINSGGQGSSKTFSVLQCIYAIALNSQKPRRITVCSYALPHLKMGAMADWERILNFFQVDIDRIKNKTESTYQINKTLIEFMGIEGNEAKGHGPRRDILYINECNRKITYEVYDALQSRTQEAVFLCFNPCQSFWVHETVIPNFKHTFIKSTYRDNPLLPEPELQNILSKKDNPKFAGWWKVYGEGELGTFEGAIFQNWRYGTQEEIEAAFFTLPAAPGLDFGFSSDPDACLRVAINRRERKLYCDELVYNTGNSFENLRSRLQQHLRRGELLICDSADARMISELRRNFNAIPINKKIISLADGLKMLADWEIIISERSRNFAKELSNYAWSDKKAGIPAHDFDHLCDAMRYVWMHFNFSRGGLTRRN